MKFDYKIFKKYQLEISFVVLAAVAAIMSSILISFKERYEARAQRVGMTKCGPAAGKSLSRHVYLTHVDKKPLDENKLGDKTNCGGSRGQCEKLAKIMCSENEACGYVEVSRNGTRATSSDIQLYKDIDDQMLYADYRDSNKPRNQVKDFVKARLSTTFGKKIFRGKRKTEWKDRFNYVATSQKEDVSSYKECEELCANEDSCEASTYDKKSKSCFFNGACFSQDYSFGPQYTSSIFEEARQQNAFYS